jgi:hypothetical protein
MFQKRTAIAPIIRLCCMKLPSPNLRDWETNAQPDLHGKHIVRNGIMEAEMTVRDPRAKHHEFD